ncbi:MAG: hypothetical protein WCA35_04710 [Kovacikia sp.]
MKNPLDYIYKYPHRTKQILGIDYKQFLQLLEQCEAKRTQQQAEREHQKIRVNAQGGGRKPILEVDPIGWSRGQWCGYESANTLDVGGSVASYQRC